METQFSLEELRVIPGGLDHAYRSLTFSHFEEMIVCPLCRCMKSGDAIDPNRPQECCDQPLGDQPWCRCHEGYEAMFSQANDELHGADAPEPPTLDEIAAQECVPVYAIRQALRQVHPEAGPSEVLIVAHEIADDAKVVCLCGERRYASVEAARLVERDASTKCQKCYTFATDHVWRGSFSDPEDNSNPRCWDCDIRMFSHGGR